MSAKVSGMVFHNGFSDLNLNRYDRNRSKCLMLWIGTEMGILWKKTVAEYLSVHSRSLFYPGVVYSLNEEVQCTIASSSTFLDIAAAITWLVALLLFRCESMTNM